MKRIYAALLLCVLFFGTVPAWGSPVSQGNKNLPAVVGEVLRNKEFFVKTCVLYGFEDCFITGAERLNDERIAVVLLAPYGFEYSLVYDVETLEAVYKKMLIPGKNRREDMRRKSISVADAVKLARFAARETAFRTDDGTARNLSLQGWDRHDDSQNEQQNQQKQKNEGHSTAR